MISMLEGEISFDTTFTESILEVEGANLPLVLPHHQHCDDQHLDRPHYFNNTRHWEHQGTNKMDTDGTDNKSDREDDVLVDEVRETNQ